MAGQAIQPLRQDAGNLGVTANASGIKASPTPGEAILGEFGNVADVIGSKLNLAGILGGFGIGAGTFAGLMLLPNIPRIILSLIIAAGSMAWLIFGIIRNGKKQ